MIDQSGRGELLYQEEGDCFVGWARHHAVLAPRAVVILRGETKVGEAEADLYRPELVAAGVGHGHYGFRILRGTAAEPGTALYTLVDGETGAAFVGARDVRIVVPPRDRRALLRVEDLLVKRQRWTEEEVRNHLDCLEPDLCCRTMGAHDFVAAAFSFVLGREADEGGLARYVGAIESRELTAHDVLATLFDSDERAQSRHPLISPLDARYPFRMRPV